MSTKTSTCVLASMALICAIGCGESTEDKQGPGNSSLAGSKSAATEKLPVSSKPWVTAAEQKRLDSAHNMASADNRLSDLNFQRVVWTRGVENGDETEQFGKLIDAAFDSAGNVLLLDKASVSIRMLDHSGKFLRTIARSGHGPGEISTPDAMFHDGKHSLYIADRENGIQILDTGSPEASPQRVELPFRANDLCLIDGRLFVYGIYQKKVAHEFALDGRHIRSFGDLEGPKDSEIARTAVSHDGKVACVPGAGLVVIARKYLPHLSAYRISDGALAWSDSLPTFIPWVIRTTPTTYTMMQPRTSADVHYLLRPFTTGFIISQSLRQLVNSDEILTTCIVDLRNGVCVLRSDSLPLIPSTRNGEAIALSERPYPIARLLKLSEKLK